jgi:TonB family protein
MTRGKKVCKILKEIRQQIADKNEIAYVTSECHFRGECKGTCPKCEAEVRYLENELNKRKQLGKAATIAGISLGIVSSFAACNSPKQGNTIVSKQEIIANDSLYDIDTLMVTEGEAPAVTMDTFAVNPPIYVTEGLIVTKDDDDDIIESDIYDILTVEVMPEYPGGDKACKAFLQKKLIYPKEAQEKRIQGKVIVRFIIEEDGSLSNIEVARGIGAGCDEEAVRLIKMMPKWKAGTGRGEAVKTRYVLPVTFRLDDVSKP